MRRAYLWSLMLLLAPFGVAGAQRADTSSIRGDSLRQRIEERFAARTQEELGLNDGQTAAWRAYADSAISRAKERTAMVEEHRSRKGEARAEVDTATKLDKMSQAMRDRADQLQKVAQDTRAFEGVLSPEQKAIFDLYWKMQFHQRKGHRPLA